MVQLHKYKMLGFKIHGPFSQTFRTLFEEEKKIEESLSQEIYILRTNMFCDFLCKWTISMVSLLSHLENEMNGYMSNSIVQRITIVKHQCCVGSWGASSNLQCPLSPSSFPTPRRLYGGPNQINMSEFNSVYFCLYCS